MHSFVDDGEVRFNAGFFAPPPADHAGWQVWKEAMLEAGGSIVWVDPPKWTFERHARLEVLGGTARFDEGIANGCHTNAALRYVRHGETIMTGYARSADGLWRSHSWTRRQDGQLVETTVPRDAYCGIALSDLEAVLFALTEDPEILTELPADRFAALVPGLMARLEAADLPGGACPYQVLDLDGR